MKVWKRNSRVVASAIIFIGCCGNIFAAAILSDNEITRRTTPLSLAAGDRVGNGGWLVGGLTLNGNATFDAVFPVAGPLRFNGNTLTLQAPLNLADTTASIISLGSIVGGGNDFELSLSVSLFPIIATGTTYTFADVKLKLGANTTLNNTGLLFTGTSVIDGQGALLTLSPTASIIVGSNTNLLLNDVTIENVHGNMIRCIDSTSTISCNNVTIILDGDMSFTQGKIYIDNVFKIQGVGYKFVYRSPYATSIGDEGNLWIDYNVTFSYDPIGGSKNLLQFLSKDSSLTLNGGRLHVTSGGLQLLKCELVSIDRSYISAEGTTDATSLILGDNITADNNVEMRLMADLLFDSGRFVDKNIYS